MAVARWRRGFFLSGAVSAVLLCSTFSQAEKGDPPDVEAHRLVHLLGYIGGDYTRAVANGKVTSWEEYEEQLELAEEADQVAARLELAATQAGRRVDLIGPMGRVRALVEAKAPLSEVLAAAKEASGRTVSAFRLEQAPSVSPNASRGKALFLEHCATCHGETGRGDTARAATLTPRPANFHDPEKADALTAFRVATTVRFGVAETAMVPFTFFSEADRWDVAFYVLGLRYSDEKGAESPTYSLTELAILSDDAVRADLAAVGIPSEAHPNILADLRRSAPYEDRAAKSPLALARDKLLRARVALSRGERGVARGQVLDAYLSGVEPVEASLNQADTELFRRLEEDFRGLRASVESPSKDEETKRLFDSALSDITRAERVLTRAEKSRSNVSTAVASATILLREGVEAALLLAALLGMAAKAGLEDKKRFVHLGWASALLLGVVTWFVSIRIVAISGVSRELIEGITGLAAAAVLFYVSYGLLAKKEVVRWMAFLREQVSPQKAALSLFFVAFVACYREAFETVLFYQALLSGGASKGAALVGAGVGAFGLVALVAGYGRAGRRSPPQVFFRVSGALLYALSVVFVGHGLFALQTLGWVPSHVVPGPRFSTLGVFPTVETYGAQLVLIGFALFAWWTNRAARGSATSDVERGPQTSVKSTFQGKRRLLLVLAGSLLTGGIAVYWRSTQIVSEPLKEMGTFALTLRLVAPGAVKTGYARIYSLPNFDRTERFGPGNEVVFTELPASLKESGAKISMITTPEFEPTWEPDRIFPLNRDVLELRMKAEKGKYEVVCMLSGGESGPPRTLRFPGFNVGDEVDVSTFISRAVLGLRVVHPNIPNASELSALSVAGKRWLRPVTSLEHLEFEEKTIVLVESKLRAKMGEAPEPYIQIAEAALAKP